MSSAALLVAALALLCVAGALFVLQRGARHRERASTERFIDSRMAHMTSSTPMMPRARMPFAASARSPPIPSESAGYAS